jgi:hypothetical protein
MAEERDSLSEDVTISTERLMRFCYLAEITLEFAKPQDVESTRPSLPEELTRCGTLMILTCSFLYSLFEDGSNSINLLKIWTGFDHPFRDELAVIDKRLEPFKEGLKKVRNRYGFHGSVSRVREFEGFTIFEPSVARKLFELVHDAKNIAVRMIHWRMEHGLEDQKALFPLFWAELNGQASS